MRKHHASPNRGDEHAGGAGAEQAGGVDDRRVERDRVGQILAAIDDLHDEALSGRDVKRVDQALHDGENDQVRDVDRAAEGEPREGERLKHRQRLRRNDGAAEVPAINQHAGDGREEKRRDLPGEADDAEQRRRVSQAIDQPGGGDGGHPVADERNDLPGEEEAVVAVAQRAEDEREPGGFVSAFFGHGGHGKGWTSDRNRVVLAP
jgi:hypothetical protein